MQGLIRCLQGTSLRAVLSCMHKWQMLHPGQRCSATRETTHTILFWMTMLSFQMYTLETRKRLLGWKFSGLETAMSWNSWRFPLYQLMYFRTGPLQCLRDVPQHLMFLTIFYDRSHAWDGHQRTYCIFDVSIFYEAFLRICALNTLLVPYTLYLYLASNTFVLRLECLTAWVPAWCSSTSNVLNSYLRYM